MKKTRKQLAVAIVGACVGESVGVKKTRKQLAAEAGSEDEDTQLTEGDEDGKDERDESGHDEERGSLLFDEADGDGPDGEDDGEDEEDDGEDEEDDEAEAGEGDEEEPEAASKPKRRAPSRRKKMSEGSGGFRGDEPPEVLRLREEMAEMRYQLHEVRIEKTIDAWGKGRFQFSETARKNLAAAEGTFAAKSRTTGQKQGRIALSKVFSDRYRAVMLGETGIRLSERMREDVNGLLELALSNAIVDLSERGSSFDMEARMTRRGGNKPQADDSDRLEQAAQRLSEMRYHKPTTSLSEAQMYEVYTEAAKEIGYK